MRVNKWKEVREKTWRINYRIIMYSSYRSVVKYLSKKNLDNRCLCITFR